MHYEIWNLPWDLLKFSLGMWFGACCVYGNRHVTTKSIHEGMLVVKDFLGHATVATTENYYINTKPAMRAAAQARKVQIESEDVNSPAAETDGSDESKPKM